MGGYYGFGYPGVPVPPGYYGGLVNPPVAYPAGMRYPVSRDRYEGSGGHGNGHGLGILGRLLFPLTLLGAAATSVVVGIRYHQASGLKKAFSSLNESLTRSLETIRAGGAPDDPAKLRDEYEKAIELVSANHHLIRSFPLGKLGDAIDRETLDGIALHSKAIQAIKTQLKGNPDNAVTLRQLLDKLHISMRDELAMGIIGRRVPPIDVRLRAIGSGDEYEQLVLQRNELTQLLGDIQPSIVPSPGWPNQDYNLASRYLDSTVDILEGANFLPRNRRLLGPFRDQQAVRKPLSNLYSWRLTKMAEYLPAEVTPGTANVNRYFWETIADTVAPADRQNLADALQRAQGLRWEINNLPMSPADVRSRETSYRQEVNHISEQLSDFFKAVYEKRGTQPPDPDNLVPGGAAQLGNPRMPRHAR